MTKEIIPIDALAQEMNIELSVVEKFCTCNQIRITMRLVRRTEVERVATSIIINNFKSEFGKSWTQSFQLYSQKGLLCILVKNAIIADAAKNRC